MLGDGALLSGVMGAFPGLRSMLYGTAALGACLVFYSGFLLVVTRRDHVSVRRRRNADLQTTNGHRLAVASGNGHAVGGNGHASSGLGLLHNGNGHGAGLNGDSHEVRVIVRRATTTRQASFASPG